MLNGLLLFAYVVPTVTPFLVSSTTMARTLGGAFVVSLIVTLVVARSSLTSGLVFSSRRSSGLILVAVAREQSSLPIGATTHGRLQILGWLGQS